MRTVSNQRLVSKLDTELQLTHSTQEQLLLVLTVQSQSLETPTDIKISSWDLVDIANLCHAGLAQDSPNPPAYYINQIMSMAYGYCDKDMRIETEEFLTEKKYLPPVDIQLAK